jgi:hypothetical protein
MGAISRPPAAILSANVIGNGHGGIIWSSAWMT